MKKMYFNEIIENELLRNVWEKNDSLEEEVMDLLLPEYNELAQEFLQFISTKKYDITDLIEDSSYKWSLCVNINDYEKFYKMVDFEKLKDYCTKEELKNYDKTVERIEKLYFKIESGTETEADYKIFENDLLAIAGIIENYINLFYNVDEEYCLAYLEDEVGQMKYADCYIIPEKNDYILLKDTTISFCEGL